MYNDIPTIITTAYGNNSGGVCQLKMIPKGWLQQDLVIDKTSGNISTAPTLIPGRTWIVLEMMDNTVELTERAKSDKAGKYTETTITGVVFQDGESLRAVLDNIQYLDFVVLVTDKNKVRRLVGNKKKGMTFSTDFTTGKKPIEANKFEITFSLQSAEPAPIYVGP